LLIPSTALVVRSNGAEVVTVDPPAGDEPATIHFRPVKVGRDYGGTVEIQSGVSKGTMVVSNPSADLVDGMKVKVVKPAER
jgi:multidrug efflux pump subunit AcrA (membrane-fusion protein)